ncbi:FMN-binding protein [Polynucleobacter sp. IMCC 29146]|uniref:FMN-binding protein n=1 Tax=Polynucleobacter sp. IMCC 29146 TaxID=2780953 RepID=UPI001F29D587|nr:FMN-binding protein [Polynucleobacter sp. IMCC 29146]MCE7529430.1 FMN-binding protein [Polynucleobacter sp. IMCC 29146]
MLWKPSSIMFLTGASVISGASLAHAKIYISAEQAQKIIFPSKKFTLQPMIIHSSLQSSMKKISGVHYPFRGEHIWHDQAGNYLIVDEVVGKHEMIRYAVGISSTGRIQGVEILEYRESYGYEVAEQQWRQQFVGKTAQDPLKLNRDIQNISGATLSSKHITDGVKRVMHFYEIALKVAN